MAEKSNLSLNIKEDILSHVAYKAEVGRALVGAELLCYFLCFPSLQASCGLHSLVYSLADFILTVISLLFPRWLPSATRTKGVLVYVEQEPPQWSFPCPRF